MLKDSASVYGPLADHAVPLLAPVPVIVSSVQKTCPPSWRSISASKLARNSHCCDALAFVANRFRSTHHPTASAATTVSQSKSRIDKRMGASRLIGVGGLRHWRA